MTARRVTALLVAALTFYLLLVGVQAVILLRGDTWVEVVFGVGLLILPLLGGWLVAGEIRFGRATERLGGLLAEEGGLPRADEVVRTAGGRIDRAAADAVFVQRRAEVEAAPEDWRTWYRLGLAYGDAGDTSRGRRAMRRAISLQNQRSC